MTIPTLSELFSSSTPDEAKARLLARLQTLGLPITDWASGGVERTIVEVEAQENSDFSLAQVPLAQSAFLSTAQGAWLDVVAYECFGRITRYPATYATDTLTLSCVAASGPYTILPGQLWVAEITSGRRYTNTTGGVLAPGGTLDLTIRAESAGSVYNAGVGTITVMVTALPGVSCMNTGVDAVPGTDAESNALLIQRCHDQWSTLGYGQNADWFRYYCRNGHAYAAQVTRVRVSTDPAGSGAVSILIAGPDGVLSGAVVAAVQASLDAKIGGQISVTVASAAPAFATLNGTAYVRAAYSSAYVAAAQDAMLALVRSLEIGDPLYHAAVAEAMMAPEGAVNWIPAPMFTEIIPAPTEVVVLSLPVAPSVVVV